MKRKLPPNVYRDRSRYAYRPYLGRVEGKRRYGKPIRLCGLDASLAEVWTAYEKVTGKEYDTLRWLLKEYCSSIQFKALKPATQEGYKGYTEVICRKPIRGGTFGDAPLRNITRRTIQRYLDSSKYRVTANRHIQYIKAAWRWASNRYESVPAINPCHGVDFHKEAPRDRYVTHEEYLVVHQVAMTMRVPYFAYAMELAYLCRARRSEVFGFRLEDIGEEGLFLRRGKGSRNEITLWTPRLRAAVEGCKTIYPDAPTPIKGGLLLHDRNGQAFNKNALDSAWQRIIKKAMDPAQTNPHLKEPFTFHDLKAKGVSDSDRQNAGGHRSRKMEAVYDRLPQKVELDYG